MKTFVSPFVYASCFTALGKAWNVLVSTQKIRTLPLGKVTISGAPIRNNVTPFSPIFNLMQDH